MFGRGGTCVDCLLLVDLVSCVVLILIRGMYLNPCPLQISLNNREGNTSSP